MNLIKSVHTSRHLVEFRADNLAGFSTEITAHDFADGVSLVKVSIAIDQPTKPPSLELRFRQPSLDVCGTWSPNVGRNREIRPDWGGHFRSNATQSAPVVALFGPDDTNRLTVACDDALNPIDIRLGLHEETGMIIATIRALIEPHSAIRRYSYAICIDVRPLPLYESLRQIASWWESLPGYTAAPVPESARFPMYSTWYSFHQTLDADSIVDECRRSKSLGCEAVIVDDGWQTLDSNRGYAYCGDWESQRIPDMASLASRVHDLGMKFLLWYSVPFVGKHSKAFPRFTGKALSMHHRHGAIVLDPRFPEVREYLIVLYESHVRQWNLDGLKLDFVDSFSASEENADQAGDGRDYTSVYEAVDRLLSEVIARVRTIRPDIMVEFRQSYVGPLMRKYGNLFRAGDCPGDYVTNRIRTTDLRMLSGNTAVHSDMIMWHPDESPQRAALQLLNVLFSVPQISVRLDRINESHRKMLQFWLRFWKGHREVLLDGSFEPIGFASNYPIISSRLGDKMIIAVLDRGLAALPDVGEVFVINATPDSRVTLDGSSALDRRKVECFDCCGSVVSEAYQEIDRGIRSWPVPPSGLLHIHKLST